MDCYYCFNNNSLFPSTNFHIIVAFSGIIVLSRSVVYSGELGFFNDFIICCFIHWKIAGMFFCRTINTIILDENNLFVIGVLLESWLVINGNN